MLDKNNLLLQLYVYELDARDKIFTRIQFNFAIYASAIASLVYMFRMLDLDTARCWALTLFFVFSVVVVAFLFVSAWYSYTALTGYSYKTLPKSKDLVHYDQALQKKSALEAKEDNQTQKEQGVLSACALFESYIDRCFSDCIDHNYQINEYRRQAVRKAIWAMLKAAIPFVILAVLFVGFDLDASSPRKIAISFSEGRPLVNALRGILNH